MGEATDALKPQLALLARAATEIVYEDIENVFAMETQFTNPQAEASALVAARPLRDTTIAIKREQGSPTPEVPRVRFGSLARSLASEFGDLSGIVSTEGEDDKMWYQQTSRPFMGVSRDAIALIEKEWEGMQSAIESSLSGVELEPVQATMTP